MPGPGDRYLSALRIVDAVKWRTLVRDALKAQGGITDAAAVLGVGRATLFRWLREEPGLREGLELPDRPGPRVGSKRRRK